MSRPPLRVPGRPASETAAEFPCPFCMGKAYYGVLGLIAASVGQDRDAGRDGIGVAHTRPSCETFRRLDAGQFVDACKRRLTQ